MLHDIGLHENWQSLRRILAIQPGTPYDIVNMSAAMEQLRRSVPNAEIVLLCAFRVSRLALSLPGVTQVFLHRAIAEKGLTCTTDAVLNLIDVLRSEQFDAAFIFPCDQMSPYPLGYVCYLAEIPIRVGLSCEFGGGVLSHWVRETSVSEKRVHRNSNLALLDAIGLIRAEVS
jgi:ADP-heptose:LPS heptosyltransferase